MTESEFESLKIGDVIYNYCQLESIYIIVGKHLDAGGCTYTLVSMSNVPSMAIVPVLWHAISKG